MFTLSVFSQSYIGLNTDNYNGVHGLLTNPASIADSRLKFDLNLVGFSALAGNDFYGIDINNLISGAEFSDSNVEFPSEDNNFYTNIDILGPSFMLSLSPKHSIGLFTRARTYFNAFEFNGSNIETIDNGLDLNDSFSVNEGDFFGAANSWVEVGLSYSRVIMDQDEHFLKGGLSVKYLQGISNAYARLSDFEITYDDSITDEEITTSGSLDYGYTDTFEEDLDDVSYDDFKDFNGLGFDLGFVYEWRPDANIYKYNDSNGDEVYYRDVNKYKLKLGLSLTDIGKISYTGTQNTYDLNRSNIDASDFDDIEGSEELEDLYTFSSSDIEKSNLPTALHFTADWNINNSFYLNFNTDLSLVGNDLNEVSNVNMFTLTPRFEKKWFTFQLPVSMQQYSGLNVGAGFRAGPLYVGSGSVITVFTNKETKAADVYLGVKVPIYQNRPKDKDEDGVFDKQDNCPKVVGPADNQGCPWEDSDGDTIKDNFDKCPNTPGDPDNYGCPWEDTDNDGILDKDDYCPREPGKVEDNGCPIKDSDGDTLIDKEDNCPFEAGPIENSGCPWPDTDGDGVTDNLDDCLTTAGTVENNGCPKLTEEVQKELNEYAKTILFDPGKASFVESSYAVLNDIIKILNEYPNSKFTVEGHTDSIGSYAANQVLSDKRAKAVMSFLVENGVDASRLTSLGYGETRPIATNMYKHGRKLNRRVEINLVK